MLLPATVDVGEHAVQERHVARVRDNGVRLRSHATRALPIARVPRHHPTLEDRITEVFRPLGLELVERGPRARNVSRRHARARVLHAQRGHLLGGRDGDCLCIRGGSIGLAGPVEELRAQRKQARTLVIRRVLERELGPRRTVAVSAHVQGPLGRLGEQRNSFQLAAGAEEVMGDPLRRRVLVREEHRRVGVRAPQSLLRQPGRELFAHQRVPEAVASPRALEHAGRLGLAERLPDPIGARELYQGRLGEAVLDDGESGEQRLTERLEPLEPLLHDLA